jgi:hypothetical protein
MNFLSVEITVKVADSLAVQSVSIALIIVVSASGLFLWFAGFRRFKDRIGTSVLGWLRYATFTIFSGFYMQYRYGSETNI